jgi:hypothetical protein
VALSVRKLWEDIWPHGRLVTIAEVVVSSTMQMYVYVLWDVLLSVINSAMTFLLSTWVGNILLHTTPRPPGNLCRLEETEFVL